ncbi:unnamed protein product, partial [Urochloa humidicola]
SSPRRRPTPALSSPSCRARFGGVQIERTWLLARALSFIHCSPPPPPPCSPPSPPRPLLRLRAAHSGWGRRRTNPCWWRGGDAARRSRPATTRRLQRGEQPRPAARDPAPASLLLLWTGAVHLIHQDYWFCDCRYMKSNDKKNCYLFSFCWQTVESLLVWTGSTTCDLHLICNGFHQRSSMSNERCTTTSLHASLR